MRSKKAAPKTAHVTRQAQTYGNPSRVSRKEWLGQAVDVLLLMQYPLTVTERAGFGMLLQRRLERAYGGPCHE